MAIERISKATTLLEERYEATESIEVAKQYAVAESNLGRIRLANGDYEGASVAFEAAIGLLDGAEEEDGDEEGEKVDGKLNNRSLTEAKLASQLGLALTRHFLGSSEDALTTIREAIASTPAGASAQDLALQLAKLLWSAHGKLGVEEVKSQLFANIETSPEGEGSAVHVPSILALAVLGLASGDADLVDAAQSELESWLKLRPVRVLMRW